MIVPALMLRGIQSILVTINETLTALIGHTNAYIQETKLRSKNLRCTIKNSFTMRLNMSGRACHDSGSVKDVLLVSAFNSSFDCPSLSSLSDKVGQSFGKSFLQMNNVHRGERFRQIVLKINWK